MNQICQKVMANILVYVPHIITLRVAIVQHALPILEMVFSCFVLKVHIQERRKKDVCVLSVSYIEYLLFRASTSVWNDPSDVCCICFWFKNHLIIIILIIYQSVGIFM